MTTTTGNTDTHHTTPHGSLSQETSLGVQFLPAGTRPGNVCPPPHTPHPCACKAPRHWPRSSLESDRSEEPQTRAYSAMLLPRVCLRSAAASLQRAAAHAIARNPNVLGSRAKAPPGAAAALTGRHLRSTACARTSGGGGGGGDGDQAPQEYFFMDLELEGTVLSTLTHTLAPRHCCTRVMMSTVMMTVRRATSVGKHAPAESAAIAWQAVALRHAPKPHAENRALTLCMCPHTVGAALRLMMRAPGLHATPPVRRAIIWLPYAPHMPRGEASIREHAANIL